MTGSSKRAASRRPPTRVGDVMRRDFVTVSADGKLAEALEIMRMGRLRHLLVERQGRLAGVLSYRDLQDREIERLSGSVSKPPDPTPELPVEQAMLESPYVVHPDTELRIAASRMARLGIGCLPVVEASGEDGGGRLVGIVTESDLLRAAYPLA